MGRSCAERFVDIVDIVLLVDRDEVALRQAAGELSAGGATVVTFPLDVSDADGVARLVARASELGVLRAVAHAAGVSPTMADWRQILDVDLVATARLIVALWPLAGAGTAMVCFASIAPLLMPAAVEPAAAAVLDSPLADGFIDQLRAVVGPEVEDPGMAYVWAKRGVHRLVRREAVRYGQAGARICSVSPGIIDTPMGRQEAAAAGTSDILVQQTPLGRQGRSEEVAATVAYLLSDEASFVSGIDIPVDGGVVAAIAGRMTSGK
jgi:NAD(P)-dependent dehydrogenase (short-subunit alcohol dehydrogenase family)